MAERLDHKTESEGRRLAPPRRIPAPANDNVGPGHRRAVRVAMIASVIAVAVTLVTTFTN